VQAVLSWYDLSYLEEKFDRWLVYFLGLVEPLNPEELREMMRRFKPAPKLAAVITQGKEAADAALLKLFHLNDPSRSQIYQLVAPLETELLLYMLAKSRQEDSRRAISLYFTHLQHLKPALRGRDLLALGYPPGPELRDMLHLLHQCRLNEQLKTREDEIQLILKTFPRN